MVEDRGLKTCVKCGEEKLEDEFRSYVEKRFSPPKIYISRECRSCYHKRMRGYNKRPKKRIQRMVWDMLRNAKKKNLDCTITFEDIINLYDEQGGKCALTGYDMTLGSSDDVIEKQYAASPDRIDNDRGYTADNVWLVTARANSLKSDMTLEELLVWCEAVTRNRDSKL